MSGRNVGRTREASECRSIARSIGAKPLGISIERPAGGWPSALHELANRRGWPVTALEALGPIAKGHELHFPLKMADGQLVGWRRRRADGQPAMLVRGSKAMLIMPSLLPPAGPVGVVESETDAAAIIAAGHSAAVATPGGSPSADCVGICAFTRP